MLIGSRQSWVPKLHIFRRGLKARSGKRASFNICSNTESVVEIERAILLVGVRETGLRGHSLLGQNGFFLMRHLSGNRTKGRFPSAEGHRLLLVELALM